MENKVLILGGNGFIGNHLKSSLAKEYEVIVFDRKTQSLEETISHSLPNIVINCSASKANATILESFDANIEFQMECISLLLTKNINSVKWIQVASYFELQIPMGRSDNYSLDKQICRSILHRLEEDGLIELTTIFLPHVFGDGEDFKRIIPSITSRLKNGEICEISRGEQFLPILGIEDCCSAIKSAIVTNQLICSAAPIWYEQVKLLASKMEEAISKGVVKINHEKTSIDNSFPKVDFPPKVNDWTPKMTFEDFISKLVTPLETKS